jgi:hypothetical protein
MRSGPPVPDLDIEDDQVWCMAHMEDYLEAEAQRLDYISRGHFNFQFDVQLMPSEKFTNHYYISLMYPEVFGATMFAQGAVWKSFGPSSYCICFENGEYYFRNKNREEFLWSWALVRKFLKQFEFVSTPKYSFPGKGEFINLLVSAEHIDKRWTAFMAGEEIPYKEWPTLEKFSFYARKRNLYLPIHEREAKKAIKEDLYLPVDGDFLYGKYGPYDPVFFSLSSSSSEKEEEEKEEDEDEEGYCMLCEKGCQGHGISFVKTVAGDKDFCHIVDCDLQCGKIIHMQVSDEYCYIEDCDERCGKYAHIEVAGKIRY